MPAPLLQSIAKGDPTAVSQCIDEYGGTIYALANRYLKYLGEDVEDAVQEVFVEIWRSASRYNPTLGSEAAFIATIAHRRLTDRQRRAQIRRTAPLEGIPTVAQQTEHRIPDHAGLRDDLRAAAVAFESLDKDEQQVLWYSLYQGFTHERIAAAIQIPVGTVKTRIRRGLMRLRELLSPVSQIKEVAR
ncbi:MAG: sigma-70 family RNA polymerase sigma factor [Phycisphaerales bacterium]|nr:sigma-70 family RNA polymerase sigma factor [Phycisphaerales bacterium]